MDSKTNEKLQGSKCPNKADLTVPQVVTSETHSGFCGYLLYYEHQMGLGMASTVPVVPTRFPLVQSARLPALGLLAIQLGAAEGMPLLSHGQHLSTG